VVKRATAKRTTSPFEARRRARRSSQRGAATTEAVVVIPFFLLMASAILFAGRMYETKLRVMKGTRQSAWNYAMCNCNDPGDGASYTCRPPDAGEWARPGGSMGGSAPGYDPSSADPVGSGPESAIARKDFGTAKAHLEERVSADVFLRGFTKQMKSDTMVMCDETPHNGDLKGWIGAAFGTASRW
jgi:hypothetical protein